MSSKIANEMYTFLTEGYTEDDILKHYGKGHEDGGHSGRYPWGSGDNPYQHSFDLLDKITKLREEGKTTREIAKELGYVNKKTGEGVPNMLRIAKGVAKDDMNLIRYEYLKSLQDQGYGYSEIARIAGMKNESSVRSALNSESIENYKKARGVADILRTEMNKPGENYIDIGKYIERSDSIGVSSDRFDKALRILEDEGYVIIQRRMPQTTNPGKFTTIKVLCPPGTDIHTPGIYDKVMTEMRQIGEYYSEDNGQTFRKWQPPASMSKDRLQIRYADDVGPDGHTGAQKDGLIEIRRGVADLNLDGKSYAQVRIMVEGTHYLKGMAVYSDDLPDGVDIVFNTSKNHGVPEFGTKDNSVLKPIKSDPNNPFGALLKEARGQMTYIDENGEEKLSLINRTREEGDWGEWSKTLPAQFLSKQPKYLAKRQIDISLTEANNEYNEIMALENPIVKEHFLQEFSNNCDKKAVRLDVAALPRQAYQVIMPVNSLNDHEIYAPQYNDGEQVALVRFPHGGRFEIPILTVNNGNKEGRSMLGQAQDAIGIGALAAQQLSGADFDGDTCLVIPVNEKVQIKNKPYYQELKDFGDFHERYKYHDGMKVLTKDETGKQMGVITNLITDMTIKGAGDDEIIRAVKHSMVIIDAAKHRLDYIQSEKDNNIEELKQKYQPYVDMKTGELKYGGANTLISKAKSEERVLKRQGSPIIDPETGKQTWKIADDAYYEEKKKVGVDPVTGKGIYEKTGKIKEHHIKSTKMMETDDATTLISDYRAPIETLYAEYANGMKALANKARKSLLAASKEGGGLYNKDARSEYQAEYDSILSKLNVAKKNVPKERLAQAKANKIVMEKMALEKDDDNWEKYSKSEQRKTEKKIKQEAIEYARNLVGARGKSTRMKISDGEWKAIQAGAVTKTQLREIMRFADPDRLRELATPRKSTEISDVKQAKIKQMARNGYSQSEIAAIVGVSSSTVNKYMK